MKIGIWHSISPKVHNSYPIAPRRQKVRTKFGAMKTRIIWLRFQTAFFVCILYRYLPFGV